PNLTFGRTGTLTQKVRGPESCALGEHAVDAKRLISIDIPTTTMSAAVNVVDPARGAEFRTTPRPAGPSDLAIRSVPGRYVEPDLKNRTFGPKGATPPGKVVFVRTNRHAS